jgi:hypothetical protein
MREFPEVPKSTAPQEQIAKGAKLRWGAVGGYRFEDWKRDGFGDDVLAYESWASKSGLPWPPAEGPRGSAPPAQDRQTVYADFIQSPTRPMLYEPEDSNSYWSQIRVAVKRHIMPAAYQNWFRYGTQFLRYDAQTNEMHVRVVDELQRAFLVHDYSAQISTAIAEIELPIKRIVYEVIQ